ncbi:MAG TPA: Type II secretory pathway, pullulanase PulA, partial [Paracoccaceae bacterium]|nr:Type II secretory pathway, pullulanase PulA [Paracoccaceae bacterium]
MIISRQRGYVFVHIPKTGGTALALALEARAAADDILIGDTPKARARRGRVKALAGRAAGRLWKHSTLADIEGVLPREEIAGL